MAFLHSTLDFARIITPYCMQYNHTVGRRCRLKHTRVCKPAPTACRQSRTLCSTVNYGSKMMTRQQSVQSHHQTDSPDRCEMGINERTCDLHIGPSRYANLIDHAAYLPDQKQINSRVSNGPPRGRAGHSPDYSVSNCSFSFGLDFKPNL